VAKLAQSTWRDENKLLWQMLHHSQDSIADWAEALGWIGSTGKPQKSKVFNMLSEFALEKMATLERKKWKLTAAGEKIARAID
jgi:hypothetical protein